MGFAALAMPSTLIGEALGRLAMTVPCACAKLMSASSVSSNAASSVKIAKAHPATFGMLLGKILPNEMTVKGTVAAVAFVPSIDALDAADRYARALRGEDYATPLALPAPEPESSTQH